VLSADADRPISRMCRFPHVAYGLRMTLPALSQVARRTLESTRVFCEACEHSEFVHGDNASRSCLYSECDCEGFRLSAG
jgi:hypothetical protein